MGKSDKTLVMAPDPPENLSYSSKQFWKEVVPSRIRSPGRLALLQTGLEARDRASQASALIGQDLTVLTPKSGCSHLNPLLKIEKESKQLFVKVMTQLGLHIEFL